MCSVATLLPGYCITSSPSQRYTVSLGALDGILYWTDTVTKVQVAITNYPPQNPNNIVCTMAADGILSISSVPPWSRGSRDHGACLVVEDSNGEVAIIPNGESLPSATWTWGPPTEDALRFVRAVNRARADLEVVRRDIDAVQTEFLQVVPVKEYPRVATGSHSSPNVRHSPPAERDAYDGRRHSSIEEIRPGETGPEKKTG
jgi:hypothetical protein